MQLRPHPGPKWSQLEEKKEKLGANTMKCDAAGAHLQTPWFFEHAKCPDDRTDYCLGCSFLPSANMHSCLQLSGLGRALQETASEQW